MIKAVIFDWGRTLYDRDNGVVFPEAGRAVFGAAVPACHRFAGHG